MSRLRIRIRNALLYSGAITSDHQIFSPAVLRVSVVKIGFPITAIPRDYGDHVGRLRGAPRQSM